MKSMMRESVSQLPGSGTRLEELRTSRAKMREDSMIQQSTNAVLMIRPHRFYANPETAEDNAFQRASASADPETLSAAARMEFDRAVATLRSAGATVHVVDDTPEPDKPDAVFPNNWLSTHHDGSIVLYPMFSALRRRERRRDIIDELRRSYRVTEVIDYSAYETKDQCLEGTGSLVLDHVHKIAYVSLSQRSHSEPLKRFCADFDYEPVTFTATDENGRPVYHTNVVMCVGTELALIALEMIADTREREAVRARLTETGKEIVDLTREQIANFAGNAIELENVTGEKLLVLSSRALPAFRPAQRRTIERYARFVPLELPTIELAGGSARCMLATIHLPPLKKRDE
jgi:hypothetical protein